MENREYAYIHEIKKGQNTTRPNVTKNIAAGELAVVCIARRARTNLRPRIRAGLIRSLTIPSLTVSDLTTILTSPLAERSSTLALTFARAALRAMPDPFHIRRNFRGLSSERIRSFCCN